MSAVEDNRQPSVDRLVQGIDQLGGEAPVIPETLPPQISMKPGLVTITAEQVSRYRNLAVLGLLVIGLLARGGIARYFSLRYSPEIGPAQELIETTNTVGPPAQEQLVPTLPATSEQIQKEPAVLAPGETTTVQPESIGTPYISPLPYSPAPEVVGTAPSEQATKVLSLQGTSTPSEQINKEAQPIEEPTQEIPLVGTAVAQETAVISGTATLTPLPKTATPTGISTPTPAKTPPPSETKQLKVPVSTATATPQTLTEEQQCQQEGYRRGFQHGMILPLSTGSVILILNQLRLLIRPRKKQEAQTPLSESIKPQDSSFGQ